MRARLSPEERADPRLVPGDPIELVLLEDETEQAYNTRVFDSETERIFLAAPLRKLDLVPVPIGSQVLLRVAREQALFSCWATVESLVAAPVATLTARLEGPWHRKQRRASVRIDTRIKPALALVILPDKQTPPLEVTIHSLSAGGALLVSAPQLRLQPGDDTRADGAFLSEHIAEARVYLEIPLGPTVTVRAISSIVRIEAITEGKEGFFRVAVRFEDIGGRQEDAIFRYVLEEQLRRRRRAL